ncbi:MAG: putative rane protein [Frankiales bacterium]|nr:putative rane protein [Frankiales bacterium]
MLLSRVASLAVARRRLVLLVTAVFLVLAGGLGGGVAAELSGGGFDDPDSESVRAERVLERQFGTGAPNLVLLVTAEQGVDDAAATASAERLVADLAHEPGVTGASSWWTSGRPDSLRSRDGDQALVLARVAEDGGDGGTSVVEDLAPRYDGAYEGLDVQVGGEAQVFVEVGETIERDILRAEAIAIPITMVLLVLVFGSAVAASLPLLIGVLSILGTFLTLHLLAKGIDVSVYSVNLATSLGLGLGIDYGLFMVTRYREQLATGQDRTTAIATTVRTAGRTVLFSALTVLLSLSALLVFPLYFLRSFAYAGIAAVAFATVGAVVVLPAALAGLGARVDSLDLRRPVRRLLRLPAARPPALDTGAWSRIAHLVMRRPLPIATTVVVLLLVAAAPFSQVVFGLPDDRVLPRDANGYQVAEAVRQDFPGRDAFALSVVAPDADGASETTAYATALSRVDGVERVEAATGTWVDGRQVEPAGPASARFSAGGGTYLSVVPAVESYGPQGEQLVDDVRAVRSPLGAVLVDGQAASLVDTKASLGARLPLALGLIVLTTFLLLFLFTGSVVLPVKALVLNLLSLCATFGAMVWVFQQGHLGGLIGDPVVTGTLDTTIPILMFCLLFGLSMDYEVFLLSRIKEVYDETGDNARAVAVGLQRTGRIVTAAAGLLAIVFLAFVSSDITFIKLLGLGTALAVVVDATLIRGALVPAFMQLAGDANWWAPAPLKRLHDRIGLTEVEQDGPVTPRELSRV